MRLLSEYLIFPRWRYILGALAILTIGGYFYLGQGTSLGATFLITQGDFRKQISVSGTVTAAQNVALGFATNGRIAGIYAKVGEYVEAGRILAETENGDLVAEVARKQAALAQAEASLASLKVGTRSEELAVASIAVLNAQAALVNAIQSAYTVSDDAVRNRTDIFFTNPRTNPKLLFTVANVELETTVINDRVAAEAVLANWALLVGKLSNSNAADSAQQAFAHIAQVSTFLADVNAAINQGIPNQTISAATLSSYATTLATARANVNTAATALTTSAAALDAARSTLALKQAGSTSETIAAQEAAVAVAAADIRSAQAKLAATRVVAPFSGTVTRMDAKVGKIISPTVSELSMQSNGIFQIETYIPEVIIARVAPGNPATTTLDAYGSSVAFPAMVVAVDPAETVKDGVPTYKTTLAFLKADPAIRSGMTANVTIVTGILHNAIVIPAGAIGTKDGVSYVSVVNRDTVIPRTVVTGPSPALGQAEILSGLAAGDIILLAPVP